MSEIGSHEFDNIFDFEGASSAPTGDLPDVTITRCNAETEITGQVLAEPAIVAADTRRPQQAEDIFGGRIASELDGAEQQAVLLMGRAAAYGVNIPPDMALRAGKIIGERRPARQRPTRVPEQEGPEEPGGL